MVTRTGTNGGPSYKYILGVLITVTILIAAAALARNQATIETNEKRIGLLEVNFAGMQKDIDYTKDGVDDIRDDVKKLLRAQTGAPSP